MTNNIFSYISFIVTKYSYNIAMLRMGDKYEYFIYNTFNDSQSGGSSTIDFCSFRGIVLTDFLMAANADLRTNAAAFVSLLETHIANSTEIQMKFNKTIPYMLFVS